MFTNDRNTYRKSGCALFMRSRDRYGSLSNMTFGFPLEVNGLRFQGPEGIYQALKFPHDPAQQARIANRGSGMDAKKEAYRQGDFHTDWDDVRADAMAYTLAVKLAQHPEAFGRELLSTKALPVVEMSWRDAFWGAIPNREETELTGTNMLGQLLTALRDEFRSRGCNVGETVREFLDASVRKDRLVINGKPVS